MPVDADFINALAMMVGQRLDEQSGTKEEIGVILIVAQPHDGGHFSVVTNLDEQSRQIALRSALRQTTNEPGIDVKVQ